MHTDTKDVVFIALVSRFMKILMIIMSEIFAYTTSNSQIEKIVWRLTLPNRCWPLTDQYTDYSAERSNISKSVTRMGKNLGVSSLGAFF